MKEKTITVGCRVPTRVYELINKKCTSKGISKQKYLLGLILEDIQNEQNLITKAVNSDVNAKENTDETLDIAEKVDRVLKRYNWY